MAKITGIEAMRKEQLLSELQRGGKFVQYQYCISIVIMTFKRGTDIYFVRADENPVVKGLGWTLFTLLAGWWGIPFGPIFTIQSLWYNLKGGHDVTAGVRKALGLSMEPVSTQTLAATAAAPPPIK
ncbi:MAG TPA: hypothetical protein VKE93_14510 [Candidatus Angelobacter sp.]|nr:hypothetical protein [Candidatus Angelobacter sp.]